MVIYADNSAWGVMNGSVCAADALCESYACADAEWVYSYRAAHFGHVSHLQKAVVFAFCQSGVCPIARSHVKENLSGLRGFT